jgi:hypothetical protein
MVNPYFESELENKKRRDLQDTMNNIDLPIDHKNSFNEHNFLDFGRWFFFCQQCRHGGHTNCINEWFGENELDYDYKYNNDINSVDKNYNNNNNNNNNRSFEKIKRNVCGVNGCNCNCNSKN